MPSTKAEVLPLLREEDQGGKDATAVTTTPEVEARRGMTARVATLTAGAFRRVFPPTPRSPPTVHLLDSLDYVQYLLCS